MSRKDEKLQNTNIANVLGVSSDLIHTSPPSSPRGHLERESCQISIFTMKRKVPLLKTIVQVFGMSYAQYCAQSKLDWKSTVAVHCAPPPQVQIVCLTVGQDSGTIQRKRGLSYDCFYQGEAVSIPRSNGRRTIAQVSSVSPTGMVVNAGGGISKYFTAPEVITNVSKLMGVYTING